MAKVRSLKYIKKEIEKVEASIRKHAKGSKVAQKKKRVLNVLGSMKKTLSRECDKNEPDSFTPIPPPDGTTTMSARKTVAKKGAKKK